MPDSIAFLSSLQGRWEGAGLNHEGQAYTGQLILDPPINHAAILLHFTATGTDGTVYHQEKLLIGVQPGGVTVAYSISNNIPGIAAFAVAEPAANTLTLTLGNLDDANAFREVILFRLEADNRIFNGYSWAMPGEAMQERSSAQLLRTGSK